MYIKINVSTSIRPTNSSDQTALIMSSSILGIVVLLILSGLIIAHGFSSKTKDF
jgi:hypothetical protein